MFGKVCPRKLNRAAFEQRFKSGFIDPAFAPLQTELQAITDAAAGAHAELDGYIGYYEPYATSHEALDKDTLFQDDVRNVIFTLMEAVQAKREGRLVSAGTRLKEARPK